MIEKIKALKKEGITADDDLYDAGWNGAINEVLKVVEAGQHEPIVKRATDIKDKNGRMIYFGDTVRFVDKVEWYRGSYWAKVANGVMTREEALKEIDEKPYEERLVEDVQDYDWLLSSEIQTYWEVVDD